MVSQSRFPGHKNQNMSDGLVPLATPDKQTAGAEAFGPKQA